MIISCVLSMMMSNRDDRDDLFVRLSIMMSNRDDRDDHFVRFEHDDVAS